MTRNQLKKFLTISGSCRNAKRWVDKNPDKSPKELWESCRNGNYLVWMCIKIFRYDTYEKDLIYNVCYSSFSFTRKGRKIRADKLRKAFPYKKVHDKMLSYITERSVKNSP